MKTKIMTVIAVAFGLTACGTPTQQAAQIGAATGNVYATYELQNSANVPLTIQALKDLSNNLPNIPLGTVSVHDQGQIVGELQAAKAGIPANPNSDQQKFLDAVASLIALATTAPANSGLVTADMALAAQQAQNVAYGINRAIAFYQGLQTGKAGTPLAAPTPTPAPTS